MACDAKLITLLFINFSVTSIYTAVVPFYPIIASDKGVNFIIIGAIIAIMPLVTFIVSPVLGKWMEKIGRHRSLLASIILAGSSLVIASVSLLCDTVLFITLGFLFRIVAGLALALNNTAGYSILSSDYKDMFTKAVGLMEMFTGLGIIVGPIITAALYTVIGPFWAFMVMAGLIYVTVIPAFFMLGKERPYVISSQIVQERRGLLKDPVVLADITCLFVGLLGIGFTDLMLTSYIVSMGASTSTAAMVYILSCITYAIASPIASYIPESVDRRFLIFLGNLLTFVSYYLIGTIPPAPEQIWVVAIGVGVMGVALAMVIVSAYPHLLFYCSNVLGIPHDDILSDTISSYAVAANGLGMVTGPIMSGILVEFMSYEQSLWVVAGMFLVLTPAYVCATGYWRTLFCCEDKGHSKSYLKLQESGQSSRRPSVLR
mmetsp:Transcript_12002/g.22944  ORF Transcript_12002/g.22944 Transcript_12002/m.22944 type:complete len:431 (+) Transcript_12002:228-1520(+)